MHLADWIRVYRKRISVQIWTRWYFWTKRQRQKERKNKGLVHHLPILFYFFWNRVAPHKMFSMGSFGRRKPKANPRNLGEKCFIWEAKTSLRGGIKASAKGFAEDDRMKVMLRHGEVCVKREALEEVNEMKQSTCQSVSTQRTKKALDSTSWSVCGDVQTSASRQARLCCNVGQQRGNASSLFEPFWSAASKTFILLFICFFDFISTDWNESDKLHFFLSSFLLSASLSTNCCLFLKRETLCDTLLVGYR